MVVSGSRLSHIRGPAAGLRTIEARRSTKRTRANFYRSGDVTRPAKGDFAGHFFVPACETGEPCPLCRRPLMEGR